MKAKRLQILEKLKKGELTIEQADKELLVLYNVVGQSEQSRCDCGSIENVKNIPICASCYNPHTGEW